MFENGSLSKLCDSRKVRRSNVARSAAPMPCSVLFMAEPLIAGAAREPADRCRYTVLGHVRTYLTRYG